jgi:MFS superfamily sulfate permease-like transporter
MNIRDYFKYDFKASLVVFLVALPLCLGIALASGAPLFAGLTAGIVGGIVAGFLSGSPLSVSGPAAGLTTIVALAIIKLGSYEAFLLSVVLAGMIQIILGLVKAGSIGHFFPASVVKGMLAAIGLILILKQVPHASGYDIDFEGDESFIQPDGQNTFSEILDALHSLTPGAIVISLFSLLLLFLWERPSFKKYRFSELLPAPLVIVMVGIFLNVIFSRYFPGLALSEKHLVSVPLLSDIQNGSSFISFPNFAMWKDPQIYKTAVTIAIVASLETLLSIEACDKLDPHRRMTPLNRELKAQGAANFISGLLGGLPVTSVVVRSSANIHAGARTKASAITHGVVLLLAVLLIPSLLRLIPLACLAGLLLAVGYKLTEPKLYREMYRKGLSQFLPFIVTVVAVILTDLLQGVFWGILVAVFFILKTNFGKAAILVNNGSGYLLKLTKDVSFLNKSTLRTMFLTIPPNARLLIDGSQSQFIDHDIIETIGDFIESAKSKNIHVELKNITLSS